jgi:adenylate cyclase
MARLILVTAERGQQAIDLRAVNSLGRHPNNTIQLLDKIVSKEHCVIEQRGDHFVLRDLGSLNGTYINGERVRGEGALKHGDEIALGATRARFDDGSGRPMTPAYLPPSPGWQAQPSPTNPNPPGASPPIPSTSVQSAHAGFDDPTTVGRSGGTAGPSGGGGYVMPRAGPSPLAQSTNSQIEASQGRRVVPPVNRGFSVPAPITSGSQNFHGTRIDVQDEDRAIGTQIAATQKSFLPYEQIAQDHAQVRADYERLRASHDLSREIALERDLSRLLDKILVSIFKFIRADRGVIFLKGDGNELTIGASRRRDGTEAPIQVSATILNHVMKERAAVLTHDAAMDFAASKGKSMILNRISSAIVVPLLHYDEILGVLWLDSRRLPSFSARTSSS